MLTILAIPVDAWGHVNPMISVVGPLKKAGHRIIFALEKSWQGKLTHLGFEEEIYVRQNVDDQQNASEHWFKWMVESGWLSDASPMDKLKGMNDNIKDELKKAQDFDVKIKEIIEKIKPDLMVVDGMAETPGILKAGIKWIGLHPANPLLSLFDKRTPPGGLGLAADAIKEWEEAREQLKDVMKNFKEYEKWWVEEGFEPLENDEEWVRPSPYLNIYFFPKEMDYDDLRLVPKTWFRFDWLPREEEAFEMPDELKDKPGKLIYLSLGSLGSGDVGLMKKLTGFLSNSPHRFIVSKGMFGDSYELPANCWGRNHLPQTSVLQLVDLAIIHGGNNSFCEAFYFGKPMIVMPLFGDQYDNAQRAQEKGFGIRIDPYKCTQEELLEAIDKLLNDKDLDDKVKAASKRIATELNTEKIVELVNEIVKN